jgi:hypothetical protein
MTISDDDLFTDDSPPPRTVDEEEWAGLIRESVKAGHIDPEKAVPSQADVLRNWARWTVVLPPLEREVAVSNQLAVMLDVNARELLDAALAEADAARSTNGNGDGSDRSEPSPFIDWSTFWVEDDQPEWAYPDILAWGRGHALYAAHKAGKSLLMLYIAAKVATETDHHVTYVDYEMTERDVRDRLAEMGYGPESDLSRLHYALLPKMPPLDTEAGGQALMDLIDVAATDSPGSHFVVVIDTISRAVVGEENDADTWRFFYLYTGLRLKQRGCTWVRLDHAGKDADRGQRGSSSKGDDVDVVWKLTVTQNGVQLKRELSRIGWVPEKVTLLKKDSPVLHYIRCTSDDPAGTLEIVQLLDSLNVPGDATNAQSRKALRGAGHSAANILVSASVRWRQMAFRESAERRHPFRERTEARDDSEQPDSSIRNDSRNDAERVPRQGTEQTPTLVEGGSGTCPDRFSLDIGDMP